MTFLRLSALAAAHGTSVDEFAGPWLDSLFRVSPPPPSLTEEERRAAFEEWMRVVESRADRYPPGFVLDDSRESMYRERLDAQL